MQPTDCHFVNHIKYLPYLLPCKSKQIQNHYGIKATNNKHQMYIVLLFKQLLNSLDFIFSSCSFVPQQNLIPLRHCHQTRHLVASLLWIVLMLLHHPWLVYWILQVENHRRRHPISQHHRLNPCTRRTMNMITPTLIHCVDI